uniref:Arrestin-like N-terminal domain-containing protein n=1 Tax=Sinocyclocheilus grahami TaxID=75366 RepID=A0A672N6X2_SINGR
IALGQLGLRYDPINESNTFTSGDIVEGRVVLELTGDANVRWTEKSGDDERTYRDRERYFKLNEASLQLSCNSCCTNALCSSDGSVIRPGRHIFLLRFQLPRQSVILLKNSSLSHLQ